MLSIRLRFSLPFLPFPGTPINSITLLHTYFLFFPLHHMSKWTTLTYFRVVSCIIIISPDFFFFLFIFSLSCPALKMKSYKHRPFSICADCDLSVTLESTPPPGDNEGDNIVDMSMGDVDLRWPTTKINTASNKDSKTSTVELPNKEQWLALRVHGGSRSWLKFSNCFP